MAEFSIINEFCSGIGPNQTDTILGVGDDAAIVAIPEGMELLVSVDTMVSGVHFYSDVSPAKLAHKILAVNLSDMAAMGATPRWATMALTIPEVDRNWLSEFSLALKRVSNRFEVQLIGGDTTQGPLTLSLTIMGLCDKSKAICRSGAKLGDDVYVSSFVGDAALGLAVLSNKITLPDDHHNHVVSALETPEPRISLGQALVGVVNSCLDVSDGLLGDLEHICHQSKVSILIDANLIPLSSSYQVYLANGGNLDLALNGGDDYELAFTASTSQRQRITDISAREGILLSRIGTVTTKAVDAVEVRHNGAKYHTSNSFEHFS